MFKMRRVQGDYSSAPSASVTACMRLAARLFVKAPGDGLQHPKQLQYDEDDRDDDQRVNAVAHSGDSGIYTWTESAKQPKY